MILITSVMVSTMPILEPAIQYKSAYGNPNNPQSTFNVEKESKKWYAMIRDELCQTTAFREIKSNIERPTLAESMALRDCNEKGEIDTLADSIQEFDMNVEMKDMKKDRPVKIDEEQLVEDFEEINIENEEFEII
ncbi:hypothetical protein O9G_004742 [Rozella allomycis CSF55]|uniref:Uncharacterized protein n=1 Tax=Rozella allomycis (strain CSF55) TaxID=988480 RepID=A0A075B4F3_ROZAC|nr:hypothetical protein O9G_004742 [Rozella allomycis CSF55]|eukprot:EPZ36315.1 hypothetical protein O9G_004742 [Rozella allomycis CSF55]